MMRKVCVITGSRAEYGLLRPLMEKVRDDQELVLQVIVTGSHLSAEFGSTLSEIVKDNFEITASVDILNGDDSSLGIARAMGKGLGEIANSLVDIDPDLVVVLGDRYEIFSAVAAALVVGIPVAHLHGGEVTIGAFDDALRHSITKMSHLHFVAALEYKDRVIQLGENPENVFLVGGLGVDVIKKTKLLEKRMLEQMLAINFEEKSLLITFHPVTLDEISSEFQLRELLSVLSELDNTTLIFTMPNADTGGRALIRILEEYCDKNSNAYLFSSLGQLMYLSCVALVDGVLGNSSSGISEVPSFKKPTINIGDRQKGRLLALSIINCEPNRESIRSALVEMYSSEFQFKLAEAVNPYGEGGATERILSVIREVDLEGISKKVFWDLRK
jgi:GDP/UDP-N,N'-diacetylbacillosamine 2-epimerase (hydrolysing)